ncbi:hypothetical protein GCM10010358_67260 [Streptomyces minutiscleroticus]|uniref:Uncharacterized protein n=1 Tax=Streptomyces minutiscleroticus TaxID=68238 RepID=A0A918NYG4_9ACTN|nr:hypothetical protein GCM10010358_67260 [Streptomyces minutiscleroticus]
MLRRVVFGAATRAARPSAPDYAYYQQAKDRCGGNRTALPVACRLIRRARHPLRAPGDSLMPGARPLQRSPGRTPRH